MKTRYLILSLTSALVLSTSIVYADDCPSGIDYCGEWENGTDGSGTWSIAGGKLTISGQGAMNDYWDVVAPWHAQMASITSVEIEGVNQNKGTTGITYIGGDAFYKATSLQSVTIPDSVTSIGEEAFYKATSLQSITIPDSVTSIGDSAFSGATSLLSITIPDSVTSIGEGSFSGATSLQSIIIGDGVKEGYYETFYNISANAKIYCNTSISRTDGSTCSSLISDWEAPSGSLVPFTKEGNEEDGYSYKIGDNYYATADMMTKNITCSDTTSCAALRAALNAGGTCSTQTACNELIASAGGGSGGSVSSDNTPKRIFTIQEANDRVKELGGDTFTFKLRYK